MGGTHYFVLRQGGGRIYVTSLHFTTKSILERNNTITCKVTDKQQRSNIPGKGLEVPCIFKVAGNPVFSRSTNLELKLIEFFVFVNF